MMKLYSVRDKVMEKCAPPFAAPNDASAARVFKNLEFPKESPISDFELVFIGDFDESESGYALILDGAKVEKTPDKVMEEYNNG